MANCNYKVSIKDIQNKYKFKIFSAPRGEKGETGETGAIGTPLVASSVSGMTDTTRNYINTTDGHWYYYDGSAWTDGGVYQATEDSDTVTELNNAYNYCLQKHEPVNIFRTTAEDIVPNKIFSTASGQLSGSDYEGYEAFTNYIDVEEGEDYYFCRYNKSNYTLYSLESCVVCFYKEDKTFISGLQVSAGNQPITAPSNAKYLRLSLYTSSLDDMYMLISKDEYPEIYTGYFQPYYTINKGVDIKYNNIIVDANGSEDYTTLQDAINYILSKNDNTYYNRYNIFIKEGQYNMGANLSQADLNNSGVSGVTVPNYTYLKGIGNKKNIVLYCTFEEKQQYISTLNLGGTSGIENLTIIGTKTRYAVHVDTAQTEEYYQTIKNCIIKGVNTYYSVVYGTGTYDNAHWEFEDVIFDATETGNNGAPAIAFTVHNSLNAHGNRFIKFVNCRFKTTSSQKNAVLFKSLVQRPNTSDSTNSANNMITYVSCYGCEFGTNGFSLTEESPQYYGSGCMYYVTGFGNKNAFYDIITTDSQDYSDRVNII